MTKLLLEAYDHLRAEHERYNTKLGIALNEHPDGPQRPQDEVTADWRAFHAEWHDLVAAAKARFGTENVDLIFAHMRIDYRDPSEWGKPLWKPGDPGPNPFGCD